MCPYFLLSFYFVFLLLLCSAPGVSNLIQQVCRLNKGLRLLNLSKTSLSSKGENTSLRYSAPWWNPPPPLPLRAPAHFYQCAE